MSTRPSLSAQQPCLKVEESSVTQVLNATTFFERSTTSLFEVHDNLVFFKKFMQLQHSRDADFRCCNLKGHH